PDVVVEAAEFRFRIQECPRIGDGGLDLEPIPHDPRIREQRCALPRVESSDALGIETGERRAIVLSLLEDRAPGEARLRSFQDQELEQAVVVVYRHAPLLVVVAAHQRIISSPSADLDLRRGHRGTSGALRRRGASSRKTSRSWPLLSRRIPTN